MIREVESPEPSRACPGCGYYHGSEGALLACVKRAVVSQVVARSYGKRRLRVLP